MFDDYTIQQLLDKKGEIEDDIGWLSDKLVRHYDGFWASFREDKQRQLSIINRRLEEKRRQKNESGNGISERR